MSCYSPYGIAEPEEEDHLDWEGELKLNENVTVGGWQAGNVHVKVNIMTMAFLGFESSRPSASLLSLLGCIYVVQRYSDFIRSPLDATWSYNPWTFQVPGSSLTTRLNTDIYGLPRSPYTGFHRPISGTTK